MDEQADTFVFMMFPMTLMVSEFCRMLGSTVAIRMISSQAALGMFMRSARRRSWTALFPWAATI